MYYLVFRDVNGKVCMYYRQGLWATFEIKDARSFYYRDEAASFLRRKLEEHHEFQHFEVLKIKQ